MVNVAPEPRLPPGAAHDAHWLAKAVALSRACPPLHTAFSVGVVVVDEGGQILVTGYSREADPHEHAEEAALAKLAARDPRLATATLYSSLEPCSIRASRPRSCTELILASGIRRVVFAWLEPELFVNCTGTEQLRAAGVQVRDLPELAEQVREINAHLFQAPR